MTAARRVRHARRPHPALRRELLRIDRLDAALRARWVASGFTDPAAGRAVDELGAAALAWLRAVVAVHGWPGRALVGARAADAAARLIQHARRAAAFQRRCLQLLRRAAAQGDAPWHHVAYLTDAARIAAGRRQLYGTKFHRRGGALVPRPIERAGGVDRRRAAVGLPPLAVYARRIQRAFR
jgi:hypothetical protein